MIRPDWEGYWQVARPDDGVALAAIETTRMEWGTSVWAAQGGSPAKIQAAIGMPFFPWLTQGAPGIGPHEAIYDALDDLIQRLRTDTNLQGLAQTQVLDKVAARWGSPLPVAAFMNYLDGKGRFRPNFYDGTRSSFCYSVLRNGGSDGDCKEGHGAGRP
jgi:hypothetical protein